MRRAGLVATLAVLLLVSAIPAATAGPQPGLFCEQGQQVHDRVFPDPDQVTDFISFDEARCGLELLEEAHPDLIEIKEIGESVGWQNYQTMEHDTFPVLAVEVTDETVPMEDKRGNLVFINSIHGNEKGAREGALRIIEDLLTGQGMAETLPEATDRSVDEVLDEVRVVFTFPNPDGWTHEYAEYRPNDACNLSPGCLAGATGPNQPGTETQNFVRVNGNGTDLNRQYPTTGTSHPSWPALTEPEIDGQVAYFDQLDGDVIAGVDLHGMLNAENLTYLMIKDTQRTLWEVPHHEAIARSTAKYLSEDPRLDPWRAAVGPATVWGSTYDLLGYSAPGTGGAYVVQDTGLDAPGFTVELAYNHIAFDNYYQGPGQMMNELHVAAMRDMALGFLDYTFENPGQIAVDGDSVVAVYDHPGEIENAHFDGTDADPNGVFDDLRQHGATVLELAPTAAIPEQATHIVVPDTAYEDLDTEALKTWVEDGGTLLLTDRALELAAQWGLGDGVRTVEDVTGNVERVDDHALLDGTHAPVGSLVDGNPLRYDPGTVPNHCLEGFTGTSVGERVLSSGSMTPSEGTPCTVLGEASQGEGTVRVMGVALPPPTGQGDHGSDGYALTPNGQRVLLNALGLGIVENATAEDLEPASAAEDGNETPFPATAAALAVLAAALVAARRRAR